MKTLMTIALTGLFLLASVPAFACDGHKAAKSDDGDALMTSVEDGDKSDTTTKKAKKSAKKDDKKEQAADDKGGEA